MDDFLSKLRRMLEMKPVLLATSDFGKLTSENRICSQVNQKGHSERNGVSSDPSSEEAGWLVLCYCYKTNIICIAFLQRSLGPKVGSFECIQW